MTIDVVIKEYEYTHIKDSQISNYRKIWEESQILPDMIYEYFCGDTHWQSATEWEPESEKILKILGLQTENQEKADERKI